MIEIEPISCAAEPDLCRAIERFPELDGITDEFWYEGDNFYKVMPNDGNIGSPASLSIGGTDLDDRNSHRPGDPQTEGRPA